MNKKKTFKGLVSNFKEYIDAAKNGEVANEGETFIFIGTSEEMDTVSVSVHGDQLKLVKLLASVMKNDKDFTGIIMLAMAMLNNKREIK